MVLEFQKNSGLITSINNILQQNDSGMKNSGLPTMVEAKSNIPKHITNTMPKTFKSSQSSSLNLLSPAKTTLSTQAWLMLIFVGTKLVRLTLESIFNQRKQILKRKLQASADLHSPRVTKKEKKVWNCIEERIQNKTEFGTTIRKIIFGDIYIDEISALSKKPFEDFTNLRVSSSEQ